MDRSTRLLYHVQYLVPTKSSTEDFAHQYWKLLFSRGKATLPLPPTRDIWFPDATGRPIRTRVTLVQRIVASSMDSGLEAFSHNPTHGSFTPLAVQLSVLPIMRTKGSSRTNLDYYCDDHSSVG